jgi:hypothetical protein
MSKKLSLIAAGLLASLSLAAHAGHNGAGGGHSGGVSAQHMSGQSVANSNGLRTGDRDLGLARAQERRNAEATAHEQADTAQGAHKPAEKPAKHKAK